MRYEDMHHNDMLIELVYSIHLDNLFKHIIFIFLTF